MGQFIGAIFACFGIFILAWSISLARSLEGIQNDGRICRDDLCYDGQDDLNEPDVLNGDIDNDNDLTEGHADQTEQEAMAGGFECPFGYRKINRNGVYFCEPLSEKEMANIPTNPQCADGHQLVPTGSGHVCLPRDAATQPPPKVCPPGMVLSKRGDVPQCVEPVPTKKPDCPPGYSTKIDQVGQLIECVPIFGTWTRHPDTNFGPGLSGDHGNSAKPSNKIQPVWETSTKQGTKDDAGFRDKPFEKLPDSISKFPFVDFSKLSGPTCGPGKVAAFSAEGIICIEPVFPTAVCPSEEVPILIGKLLKCAPCPRGQTVVHTDGGLICAVSVTMTTKDHPTTELPCPEGLVPMQTAVGRICQYVSPSGSEQTGCPSGQKASTVNSHQGCTSGHMTCPEGMVTIETDEGKVCGFMGTPLDVDEDDFQSLCPDGMVLQGDRCLHKQHSSTCQDGQLPVTLETGSITCDTGNQAKYVPTPSIRSGKCEPGSILTQTVYGFRCKPTEVPSDQKPICNADQMVARLGTMFECISSLFADLQCESDEIMTRIGDDFTCLPADDKTPVVCGPSDVVVMRTDGSPKCLDLTHATDVCGPGYLVVLDNQSPSGFICREQHVHLDCPPGFELKLTGGKAVCVSTADAVCINEDGEPISCPDDVNMNYDIDLDLVLSLCDAGYQAIVKGDETFCVRDTAFIQPHLDPLPGMKPCFGEGCMKMQHFESPKWMPGINNPCPDPKDCTGRNEFEPFPEGHFPPCADGIEACHGDIIGVSVRTQVDGAPELPSPGELEPCTDDGDVRPCDLDLDQLLAGCNPDCANGGTCVNRTCVCPSGLTGKACQLDEDECLGMSGPTCDYRCENTFGSFRCVCSVGFVLAEDQRSCTRVGCIPDCLNGGACLNGNCQCPEGFKGDHCQIDRDECEEHQGRICQYRCRNTYGGYQCVCPPGSRLAPDLRTCINTTCIPECRNGGTCDNHRCMCPAGYYGIICQFDINECRKAAPCEQTCHNTRGSYVCSCRHGYYLNTDGRTCSRS